MTVESRGNVPSVRHGKYRLRIHRLPQFLFEVHIHGFVARCVHVCQIAGNQPLTLNRKIEGMLNQAH